MAVKALAGWARNGTEHGIVLTMQLATSRQDFNSSSYEKIAVVMNERQLRSLARDLCRAVSERGSDIFAVKPWWRFWG